MNKVFGFIVSIFLIGLGVGGLFYLSHPKEYSDAVLEDISPMNGYNWDDIKEGMYVKLDANNQIGYYSYSKDENGKDTTRLYLVCDYNTITKSYSHIIGVMVNSEDFDKWDSLESKDLSSVNYLKKASVTDHVHKIPSTVLKSLKNSLVFDWDDDADKIEKILIPYYVGPAVMTEELSIYKIVSWIAIGLGGVLLLVSFIGLFIRKD